MSSAVDALVVLAACWGCAIYFIVRSRRAIRRAEWALIDDRMRANAALRGRPHRETTPAVGARAARATNAV